MPIFNLLCGDAFVVLKGFKDNSIDSIVTDPPYGLKFMGRKWDYDVPSVEIWEQCLRVLKPGGYLLAFAGTRTQHRMAVNIEDAGFEIRDMIAWVYGSGFPKAKSCLKPAFEPITMARKPAKYVQPLNIDGCRIEARERTQNNTYGTPSASADFDASKGRWPANLIHDGSNEVTELFPEAKGAVSNGKKKGNGFGKNFGSQEQQPGYGDSGSAARFFYCPKANKKDRGEGNNHPTVKPTDLMGYLVRLVTPLEGVVLDPFMGSGSTGVAAIKQGFAFTGIDLNSKYVELSKIRIKSNIAL